MSMTNILFFIETQVHKVFNKTQVHKVFNNNSLQIIQKTVHRYTTKLLFFIYINIIFFKYTTTQIYRKTSILYNNIIIIS